MQMAAQYSAQFNTQTPRTVYFRQILSHGLHRILRHGKPRTQWTWPTLSGSTFDAHLLLNWLIVM
jgi:hypothetical protein